MTLDYDARAKISEHIETLWEYIKDDDEGVRSFASELIEDVKWLVAQNDDLTHRLRDLNYVRECRDQWRSQVEGAYRKLKEYEDGTQAS